ncbi:hypothetical protein UFOVP174_47 [uncultured Caudovirales phage]|uniref:Uncharacterized protein n=1 Tax=uncultured Caudovirales phage TaxID=2100421 RepID=A0A6J7WBU5_9CAUD|nr:hypothetical protein UFOVP174_47 [uncultured Caudovirales phage]
MADNQMVKIEFDFDLGNVPASAKKFAEYLKGIESGSKEAQAQLKTLGNEIDKTADKMNKSGSSIKKSNQQWTNFALVIQDLPYGFRGIQNNLPALLGGIAGLAGPIYLVGSAVIALVTLWDQGFFKMKNATEALTKANKEYAESIKTAMGSASEEIAKIKALTAAASNQELSMSKRLKAVKLLQDQYPSYFGNLKQEQILNGNVTTAIDKVKFAILERAKATAIGGKINTIASEKFVKEEELFQLALQKTKRMQSDIALATSHGYKGKALKSYLDFTLFDIREKENLIKGEIGKLEVELNRLGGLYEKTTANTLDLGPNDDKKKAAASLKVYKANLKAQAKLLAEMRKRAALSMNQGTSPIADSYEQDIKNAEKEVQDNLAFQIKNKAENSKKTIALIKEQYQTEVNEAEGSYEKIKIAQDNMAANLNAAYMKDTITNEDRHKAFIDLTTKQTKAAVQNAKELMAQTVQIGIGIMNALGPALDLLLEKGANIGEVLTKAFQDIIKKLVKVAITAAIAVAIMSLIPGLIQPGKGLATFGNLVAGGMGLGSALFGGGGGTGADASQATNAINTIQTNQTGDNNGQFVLRGNDLVLALNRSETSLNLRRGA